MILNKHCRYLSLKKHVDRDALSLMFKIKYFSSPFFAFLSSFPILVLHFIHMPALIELPSRSHDKPIGVSPSCR